MATPRTPNQKKRYKTLNKRLNKYAALVQNVYDSLALDATNIVLTATDYSPETGKPFRFKDYPQTKTRVNDLMRFFSLDLNAIIFAGTTEEWRQSNLVQDLLANDVLRAYRVKHGKEKYKKYYQTNNDALKAFRARKDKGKTYSQKIWNQSYNFKKEMEYAISSAIEKGQSAVALSKRISKYLHDFPSLKDDYKERYGKAVDCLDCEYRSIRLARSEINMAYRTAEQIRWEQMDFIKGYEIKLSGAHPRFDVCDELVGVYPKWFKFVGFHANCMCYTIPIVMTDDEWYSGKGEIIDDVPDNYKEWCARNANRILVASEKGTLPYFIKDNYKTTIDIINSTDIPPVPVTTKDIQYLLSHKYLSQDNYKKIGSAIMRTSPEVAQKTIENIFVAPAAASIQEIAEGYAKRNNEIKILLSSLERMKGNDGIGRLKTISRLKDICAEETIKDLKEWGYVNDMTFKGTAKDFLLSSGQTKITKQGISVEIPETKVDLVIFKDKYERQFAYPLGASRGMFNATKASEAIQEFPPYFRRGIKRVTFLDQENPFDPFWRIEYENPNHVSMASDGGRTTFFLTPKDKEDFRGYMAHEGGHILDGDTKHIFSSTKGWVNAIKADDEFYSSHGIKGKIRISKYAKTNNSEDFAESMKAYLTDHEYFKQYFPNRAAFIRKLAQKYSKR